MAATAAVTTLPRTPKEQQSVNNTHAHVPTTSTIFFYDPGFFELFSFAKTHLVFLRPS